MTYYAKVVNGQVTDIVSSQKDFTQLQPYQQEMWVKMASMDSVAKKRFHLVPGIMNYGSKYEGLGSYGLMIEDYSWWTENEREILNWMAERLPRGIEHQQGMILTFDTEHDRLAFLMRFGP